MSGEPRRVFRRYVAVGDSFTEGIDDPDPATPGRHRGWADRLAEVLDADARAAGGRLEYANLAVRGRKLGQVVAEQLDTAVSLHPDLVSFCAGGNDILRPGTDVDALATDLDNAVARLRAVGADVLLATGFDPGGLPVVRWTRGRVAAFNLHVWSIAQRHDALVLDLWSMRALYDARLWAPDRIHLAPEGHARVALLAAATVRGLHGGALGAAEREWAAPLPPHPAPGRVARARADAQWARTYLAPWVRRRIEGRSSGDGVTAKRPEPLPLDG
ncbi:Lysophospholipase L1 [Quadrisphaera granulorum]|uniref:Lysophospholipase L1-like esterase n=1 Tax=Quadrisphaera granulorum TaxID=317664 RepID=A0A315ZVY9_9ACTN|nr:SGNH/GDSL hydrolase family protein [Quadrisphaera granulorum]PWJ49038.1 lysophospholipase L1-like esterase [Quadrisphaera granulorum]SZE98248.1 Lysophospholipase L1 [Quadrisphaera granulorum]